MESKNKNFREKPIPEKKIKTVETLKNMFKEYRTTLIASIKNLPSNQFQNIRKKLRGEARIIVPKKNIINRAINESEKGAIKDLKKNIHEDIAILFSNDDPFELSAKLAENKHSAYAKAGQTSSADIIVEAGPTELMPGPEMNLLSNMGIKIAIEQGKIAIKEKKTLTEKGKIISEEVANILQKLNIKPFLVGFEPLAAFDREENKIYVGINIDKEETINELKTSFGKALAFAVEIGYPAKETISYLLSIALSHEKALSKFIEEKSKKEEVQTPQVNNGDENKQGG